MKVVSRVVLSVAFSVVAFPRLVDAQGGGDINHAFELERTGRYEEAATKYKEILRFDRDNFAALLGLERVSEQTRRYDTLLVLADSVLDLAPLNSLALGVKLRTWARLGDRDSLTGIAQRWIDADPDSPDPYREWSAALSLEGDLREALAVLRAGVEQLGGADLAPDVATLHSRLGEWTNAAEAWSLAVEHAARHSQPAILSLARTPPEHRDMVITALAVDGASDESTLVAANLLARWARPLEAWVLLAAALPQDRRRAVALLRRFGDRARQVGGREGARARGFALERVGQLLQGDLADAAKIEAASAFLEAGETHSAERLLALVDTDARSATPAQMSTMVGLIRMMAESGAVVQAERRFFDLRDRLRRRDAILLRESIAWGWIHQDSLVRAELVLAGDTTVGTAAILGWIELFRGNVAGSIGLFRSAGPRARSREASTRRTEIVALLQRIAGDSAAELGTAIHLLVTGDSAQAITALELAAETLPGDGGGADVVALAGRVAVEMGDYLRAETILLRAISRDPDGPSAATAQLGLARVYLGTGRREEATRWLENVILNYPLSAVVPSARRLLDQITEAIPQT